VRSLEDVKKEMKLRDSDRRQQTGKNGLSKLGRPRRSEGRWAEEKVGK